MIKKILSEQIKASLVLSTQENLRAVLVDSFDPIFNENAYEASRNLFLINSSGEVIWRVYSDFDDTENEVKKYGENGGFVEISISDGKLFAIRWDTYLYSIDEKTGFAKPEKFLK